MKKIIAERKLLYSLKGAGVRKELIIGISAPFLVENGQVNFSVGKEGCWGCHIEIEGVDERYPDVYGADALQAINIASNVEPFLKRLQKKYDLFFPSGEPYFDASDEIGN